MMLPLDVEYSSCVPMFGIYLSVVWSGGSSRTRGRGVVVWYLYNPIMIIFSGGMFETISGL